jgi:hypothetical protein
MDPQLLKTRKSIVEGLDDDPHLAQAGMIVVVTADELRTKLQAFNDHRSQNGSRRADHQDFDKQLRVAAEYRGRQVEEEYGEGLTQVSWGGQLFVARNRLAEALGDSMKIVTDSSF